MALIPYVYNDIGLTDQFDDATDTLGVQAISGESQYGVFYIGTPTSGQQLEDSTSPGSADITVSITDSNGATDVETTDIKLSVTSDFTGATGGASLAIGTTIVYGTPAAVYYQWTNNTGGGDYTDISLSVSAMQESAIP
jgi:phage tail sheath gpL-like